MRRIPLIALLTDFGTEDGYVGAMKGRILSQLPEARIVDITHDIRPYNVRQAAFCLNNSYPHFPDQTVFVVVVDPGVGTERKSLVVKTSQHIFVGPDNGAFSFVFYREGYRAYEIQGEKLGTDISPTFHGRDIFAPAAAMIAGGSDQNRFLTRIQEVRNLFYRPKKVEADRIGLEVIHVDHFGNLIINFHRNDQIQFEVDRFEIDLQDGRLTTVYDTFGDAPEGELMLVWDSSGFLQIAEHAGNAHQRTGLQVGDQLDMYL